MAPRTYRSKFGQNFDEKIQWQLMESNSLLQNRLEELAFINQAIFHQIKLME